MGEWAPIVRLVAGGDYDAVMRVLAWPLDEVLSVYLDRCRDKAWRDWQHDCVVWAAKLNPWSDKNPDPPELPEILKK